MSTLVAQTISNGTVSTSSANVIQGSAKAWVNFDGTLVSPGSGRANYNVSSVTKNSTGNYTVNFTTAFADANYSAVLSAGSAAGGLRIASIQGSTAPSASAIRVISSSTSADVDVTYYCVSIFR